MEFQMTGPATEKALSPNLVLVLGLVYLLLPEERSCQCVEVLLTSACSAVSYSKKIASSSVFSLCRMHH